MLLSVCFGPKGSPYQWMTGGGVRHSLGLKTLSGVLFGYVVIWFIIGMFWGCRVAAGQDNI